MNIPTSNTDSAPSGVLVPLQLFASRYGYAALLDADGNEQVITENMIQSACEAVMDTPYSFLGCKSLPTAA